MTQEEKKLKKLLEIASDNGWWEELNFYGFAVYPSTAECNFMGITSLNDLVTNWEEGEVSFIEALCKANEEAVSEWEDFVLGYEGYGSPYVSAIENITLSWSWDGVTRRIRPTSKRLEFLFTTFNHLLK